jgi:hypothetical protein
MVRWKRQTELSKRRGQESGPARRHGLRGSNRPRWDSCRLLSANGAGDFHDLPPLAGFAEASDDTHKTNRARRGEIEKCHAGIFQQAARCSPVTPLISRP